MASAAPDPAVPVGAEPGAPAPLRHESPKEAPEGEITASITVSGPPAKAPAERSLKASAKEAWGKVEDVASGPITAAIGRALVCIYFMSVVFDKVEVWQQLKDVAPARPRMADEPAMAPYTFPFIPVLLILPCTQVLLILPCALLAAFNVLVPVTASVLAAYSVYDDALPTWGHLLSVIRFGSRPTELVVKRLAIIGAVLLVLAHAFKERRIVRSYAGLLMPEDSPAAEKHGPHKSVALLVGRLLVACLCLSLGITQVYRIMARGAMHVPAGAQHHWGMADAHDNNWLLLELLLSVPFVLGFKAKASSRVLALVFALEAFSCWHWWLPFAARAWPSWHYRAHVRLHFFTNLAMVGALLLLQGLGHGVLTVDELLKKTD